MQFFYPIYFHSLFLFEIKIRTSLIDNRPSYQLIVCSNLTLHRHFIYQSLSTVDEMTLNKQMRNVKVMINKKKSVFHLVTVKQ